MKKRVVFEDEVDQYARLKIRLRHDGITQGQFFRYLVNLYTNEDLTMVNLIEKLKEVSTTRGKDKKKKTKDLILKGKQLSDAYNLSDKEKEDIFDLLEEEIGDL